MYKSPDSTPSRIGINKRLPAEITNNHIQSVQAIIAENRREFLHKSLPNLPVEQIDSLGETFSEIRREGNFNKRMMRIRKLPPNQGIWYGGWQAYETSLPQEARPHMAAIIEGNIGLIIKGTDQYSGLGIELPDLINEAILGVHRAVVTLDSEKGGFSTHATNHIRGVLSRMIKKKIKHEGAISLAEPVGREDSGRQITLADRLGDPENFTEGVLARATRPIVYEALAEAYNKLTPRQKDIYRKLIEGKKQADIIDKLHIAGGTIRRDIDTIRKATEKALKKRELEVPTTRRPQNGK